MSAAVVFQMWMLLLLGTVSGVGRAQVSTAKVMRGNNRRDGECLYHLILLLLCLLLVCCVSFISISGVITEDFSIIKFRKVHICITVYLY